VREQGLTVLTSGPIPPNPTELLNTATMSALIREMVSMSDMVIFDSPPALPVADTQVLSTKVDGVILVIEMGKAKKGAVRQMRALFDQARARIIGTVMNKMGRHLWLRQ
ncbi:MAG: hypothetical protein C4321_08440, partial [Chloroflexota bacterium]